jgi:CubicO group peptidase (beta-lactamase class C family)
VEFREASAMKIRPGWWPALCLWFFALVAAGPTAAADARVAAARELLRADLARVPAAQVAVMAGGELVWSEAFGFADLSARRAATTTTRFRIASVSKPLTAAGLMRLVEAGKLDLDAPVQRYVPAFPVKQEGEITTRRLAGHLAGIRHYTGPDARLDLNYSSVQTALKIFAADPLVVAPGTKYHYSTFAWTLVSAAMEKAAQRDFLAFMEAEVFAPLGMARTRPDRHGTLDAARATFYARGAEGKFHPAPKMNPSYKWAGGGFLSTAEDLARFGSALLQPGYLKAETLAEMFTSQKTTAGDSIGYGIGWRVLHEAGVVEYAHTGGQPGCTAVLLLRPEAKVVVAILTNVADAEITRHARALADLFQEPPR